MRLIRNTILLGAGYVFGARAGTGRYDEIVRAAEALAARPEVQTYLSLLREKTGLGRSSPDVVVAPPLPTPGTSVPPRGAGGAVTPPVARAALVSPVDPASVRRPSSTTRP